MNDQMPNVEQVIAGMRDETAREIGKDTISAAAQVAWYWSYIGALDMAQQLGLIDDTRRQELYHEADKFKPVCEVKAVQQGDHLAAVEMSEEQNYNQIDGIPNNTAPKPSVLGTLRQCREDAEKYPEGAVLPKPDRGPER